MKMMLHNQEAIIVSTRLIASMIEGAAKDSAIAALTEIKKTDDLMRKRLFILQVQREYGEQVADKLSRTKAGEFLDPDLNKILEEENKLKRKVQLELEKEKEKLRIKAKRTKFNSRPSDYGAGPSNAGGYQGATRGRGGYSRGGGTKHTPTTPPEPKRCYICQSTQHLARNCTSAKK
jgi:hypothetical protein